MVVLRYKILIAWIIVLFGVAWLGRIQFFPLSSDDMYAESVLGQPTIYYVLRDASGKQIDDTAAFYVAPTTSAHEVADPSCFSANTKPCMDYYRLVARWIHGPITIEQWRWDYASGARTKLNSLTVSP